VDDDEHLVFCEDMTISREEFQRSLPAAVGHTVIEAAADEFRHRASGMSWRIALAALPDLRLGLLALPRFRVRIFLAGYADADARRFLDRFELYFRRGGG
jgi:hypothetical protein